MTRWRLVLVLCFLLLPLSVWTLGGWRAAARGPARVIDPPDELAGLSAVRDESLGDRILEVIEPEDYLLRLYADDDHSVWVYVAFYSGYGATAAHDPNICYPSQGWVLSELQSDVIGLGERDQAHVRLFRAEQRGSTELVLYWFQPAHRSPRAEPGESLVRLADAVSGSKQYAFVRLSTAPPPRSGGPGNRIDLLRDVARELAPWVRATLER